MGNSVLGTQYASGVSVHPHGRGELRQRMLMLPTQHGSSPRTWGTRLSPTLLELTCWFIPTDVGNSIRSSGAWAAMLVHPHGRGELQYPVRHSLVSNGSSPRTWGTRGKENDNRDRRRFIPTDVGNSLSRYPSVLSSLVHPHGRGELLAIIALASEPVGSSPRTWGTLYNSNTSKKGYILAFLFFFRHI